MRRFSAPVVLGLATAIAGCGLIVDTDRQQCKSAAECAKSLGGEASNYSCEEGLCRTNNACTVETVATACGDSPSVQCVNGACVDEKWGCWNDVDDRPAPTQSTATLNLKLVAVFGPLPSTVAATVCRSPTIDPTCASQLAPMPTYNSTTGALVASGIPLLPIYVAYRVMVDPPSSTGLRAVDYYANRPLRDGDVEAPITIIPLAALDALPLTPPLDPARGNLIVRVSDCTGKFAEGVQATIADPPSDIGILYPAGMGELSDADATSPSGVVNIYNTPVDKTITIVTKVSPTKEIRYSIRAFAGRYSFVDIFPRKFQ